MDKYPDSQMPQLNKPSFPFSNPFTNHKDLSYPWNPQTLLRTPTALPSPRPRPELASLVATSHLGLLRFKLVKVNENQTFSFSGSPATFKHSVANVWPPSWAVQL